MNYLEAPIWSVVGLLPILVVAGGGIAVAAVRRQRHPHTSLLAGGACAFLLVLDVVGRLLQLFVYPWLFERAVSQGAQAADTTSVVLLLALSTNTAYAIAFVTLFVAAFRGRE